MMSFWSLVAAVVAVAVVVVAVLSALRLRRERARLRAVLEQCKHRAAVVPAPDVEAALEEFEAAMKRQS